MIKHGSLEIPSFSELFQKPKQCHDYFTNAITDQLSDAICDENEFKHDAIQNAIDKAFNNLHEPVKVVMNDYHHILTTLRFTMLNGKKAPWCVIVFQRKQ